MNFHKQDEEELGRFLLHRQKKECMALRDSSKPTYLPKIQASVEFVEQGEGKKAGYFTSYEQKCI